MKYEIECEVMSRNPDIACSGSGSLTLHRCVVGRAQDAVDFARQWVLNFSGSEIPANAAKWYNGSDIPRAYVRCVAERGKQKGQARLILSVFRNFNGEYCEKRHDRSA